MCAVSHTSHANSKSWGPILPRITDPFPQTQFQLHLPSYINSVCIRDPKFQLALLLHPSLSRTMDGRPTTRRSKDFQRVYKACESCRKKKIRCVLDGTGNPPQPPCARCKRELRECIFSPERSYRKRDGGQGQGRLGKDCEWFLSVVSWLLAD